MKIYLIAGESSGDLYGALLMEKLRHLAPDVMFRFWGGPKMLSQSENIAKHIEETSFMGFVEVLANLKTIRSLLQYCKDDIRDFNPDVIVYIDYPGFNLRIAEWATEQGFKNIYCIPPKVWAWKENRIKKLSAFFSKIICIFPFEPAYYASHNMAVEYWGNPLYEQIRNTNISSLRRSSIALLPGSRVQEIKRHLPVMKALALQKADESFEVLVAPTFSKDDPLFSSITTCDNVSLVTGKSNALFSRSKAAVVCSGTATLEAAAHKVPQVVIYKANPISYAIAKRVVRLQYISLVNLIMDKEIVKEYIQEKATVENVIRSLDEMLKHPDPMIKKYHSLDEQMNSSGSLTKICQSILDSHQH